MSSKFFVLTTVSIFIIGLVTPLAIFAKEEETRGRETNESTSSIKPSAMAEQRSAVNAERCKAVETAVNKLSERYSKNHAEHVKKYLAVVKKVQDLEARLTVSGYNTTKLVTDLKTVNSYILEFNSLNTKFQAALKESKDITCGTGTGEYKSKITEARAYLKDMHDTAKKIIQFISKDIRQDVQDLKAHTPINTIVSPSPTANN